MLACFRDCKFVALVYTVEVTGGMLWRSPIDCPIFLVS